MLARIRTAYYFCFHPLTSSDNPFPASASAFAHATAVKKLRQANLRNHPSLISLQFQNYQSNQFLPKHILCWNFSEQFRNWIFSSS